MVASGSRQGAVRRRPGERAPLNGRHADMKGARRDWRYAIATRPARKTTVAMMIAVSRRLATIRSLVSARRETGLAGRKAAARHGEPRRARRHGQNGQGQREEEDAQPVAAHDVRLHARIAPAL